MQMLFYILKQNKMARPNDINIYIIRFTFDRGEPFVPVSLCRFILIHIRSFEQRVVSPASNCLQFWKCNNKTVSFPRCGKKIRTSCISRHLKVCKGMLFLVIFDSTHCYNYVIHLHAPHPCPTPLPPPPSIASPLTASPSPKPQLIFEVLIGLIEEISLSHH